MVRTGLGLSEWAEHKMAICKKRPWGQADMPRSRDANCSDKRCISPRPMCHGRVLSNGLPVQSAYPAGPAAILHRPDPIVIVAAPSFMVELAYVKLPS
jgi:hypothetical protein